MAGETGEVLPLPLAGGVHSTRGSSKESERLLDMLHELEMHRAELALQAEVLAEQRRELSAACDRYFDLYELAPVGYLTVDPGCRIVRANLTASALLGIDRQALVGTDLTAAFDPTAAELLRRAVLDLVRNDARSTLDGVAARHSEQRTLRLTFALAGEAVVVALFDIGAQARRNARAGAADGDAELETILDAVKTGIVTIDALGRIRACNARMAELFGRRRERLLGTALSELIPGVPLTPTTGHLELVARTGSRRFPVEVSVSASEHPEGRLVVAVSDVSERKQEQRERNEALLRFNQIAERVADAFYVAVASSGESLYVSPAFAEIYARPLVAHESEPWPRLRWVHADDRARVREAVERVWGGGAFDLEYRVVQPNGEVRFVHDRAFMLADQKRVTGIVRDVTRERAMEQELEQARRLEAMGTLASGVAHDFNNLLMGVGGCVQLALRRLDGAHPAHAYLRRAADGILRGANLTGQILRIGDTRRSHEGSVVLDDVVGATRSLLKTLLGDAVTLTVQTDAPGCHVAAEAGDIEQILMNLATNARDAMPKGGTLTLFTEVRGEQLTLSVEDTGFGMSPAVRSRVFEPFFTTKPVGKGTGLGLSTIFALVRRLGGTVALESEVGRGTTVRLSLPIVEATAARHSADSVPAEPGGETVLMVDDDPLVRLTVENHLEMLGYRMLIASSAEEAIEICEDSAVTIDVMITDVMMPGMLGSELAEALRARRKSFPVLFMSAHPRTELVKQGHLSEDARLLAKPFDAPALSEALTATLEEARRARQEASLRILVVDDNLDIAEGLQEILELEGHQIEIATRPEDALRVAPVFLPQVVLCDLALGTEMDGFELTLQLKRDPRLSDTTFIALTGFHPSECREQAAKVGLHKVLTKPVDPRDLSAVLRSRPR